jgi:hypothetical protein
MLDQFRPSHQGEENVTLKDMPAETMNIILSNLRPHELTSLARVSKKYREVAQSALWRSIELHRQDAHHNVFEISGRKCMNRSYLDAELRDPWSYRDPKGADYDFDYHNAKFGAAVRKLYRTAGQSEAWTRLAPNVRHLCLTVTHRSPSQIWDMIMSLSRLDAVEIIGEYSMNNRGPPQPTSFRTPHARKIRHVRLRGYIPTDFVSEMCSASASSIVSLDLGALEPPQAMTAYKNETEQQQGRGHRMFLAPRGVLWFYPEDPTFRLDSLTYLLLCKRGSLDGPPGMSEEGHFVLLEDDEHDELELKQWASLLCSVRSTIVEIVLEQRPVYSSEILNCGLKISPHDETSFSQELHSFDSLFHIIVLKSAFDNGKDWPKLTKLTLRGINLDGFEAEAGESFQVFKERALPGVTVLETPSNYMFFDGDRGVILNQHGADGLKPHLDPNTYPHADLDDFYS